MAIDKIIGLIGIAIAILSAFVTIPHAFLILTIVGFVVGFWVTSADQVRLILTAIALLIFSGQVAPVTFPGKYIGAMLASGGHLAMGAALMVILRNLYERISPASKAVAS